MFKFNLHRLLCLIALVTSTIFAIGGDYDFKSNVQPATTPPGGITSPKAPQFVVLGSDDNALGAGLKWIIDFIAGKKNPVGSNNPSTYDDEQITMSFYCNSIFFYNSLDTNYDPTVTPQLKRAYTMGCEITNHTHSHVYILDTDTKKRLDTNAIKNEVTMCTNFLRDSVGIKLEHMKGFRVPFLAYTDSAFIVTKSIGFTYDCSIAEGFQSNMNAGSSYWPYTLDYTPPGNDKSICWLNQTFDTPIRKRTGLWVLPCYAFNTPSYTEFKKYGLAESPDGSLTLNTTLKSGQKIDGLDYNMWANTDAGGFKLNKAQSIAALKNSLDLHYKGNRTPFTIGMHSQDYVNVSTDYPNITNPADRKEVIETFLNYALDKTKFPDVRFVSGAKAIAWCMKPVALGVTPIVTNPQVAKGRISIGTTHKGEISISVKDQGIYSISIYSPEGKLVRNIANVSMGNGTYLLRYDAKNIGARMYVVSVTGKSVKAEQKLMLY
jgi:peptidoglycan/xylan/chitin deacetylase (PgdA/CDA1 family)